MSPQDTLRARLVATQISRREYLTLRNTVKILRGVALSAEQNNQVEKFEETVRQYERLKKRSEAHG